MAHTPQGASSEKSTKNCQGKNAQKIVKLKRVARIGDSVFCNSPFQTSWHGPCFPSKSRAKSSLGSLCEKIGFGAGVDKHGMSLAHLRGNEGEAVGHEIESILDVLQLALAVGDQGRLVFKENDVSLQGDQSANQGGADFGGLLGGDDVLHDVLFYSVIVIDDGNTFALSNLIVTNFLKESLST